MHLRSAQNQQMPIDTLLSITDEDSEDSEQLESARNVIETAGFSDEDLIAAIDQLPEHHKMVFNMYVMDDFSHKQISAELNISQGTSKSHLARARKKIQQLLYNDAMNRKNIKERKGRRASAFLLFFPAKEHYIDKLYREGLSDYTITPAGGTEFISAALEQQAAAAISVSTQSAATVITQSAAAWGSKISYIAACCGTAAVTGSICWLSMSENSPLNKPNIENDAVIINVIDSLMNIPNQPEMDNSFFDETYLESFLMPNDNGIINEPEFLPHSKTKSKSEPTTKITNDNDVGAGLAPTIPEIDPDLPAEKIPTEPIVIKKEIIQRQTVVVRDTIYIEE